MIYMKHLYIAPLAGTAALLLAGCGTTTPSAASEIGASSRSNAPAPSNMSTPTSKASTSPVLSSVPSDTKPMTMDSVTLRVPDGWSIGSPSSALAPGAKQVTATSGRAGKVTIHRLTPEGGNAFVLLPQLPKPPGLTSNVHNQSPYFTESEQTISGVINAAFSDLTITGTEYMVTMHLPSDQSRLAGSILRSIQAPPPATVTEAVHLLPSKPSPSTAIPLVSARSGSNRWILAGGQPSTAQEGWFLFRSHDNGNHWSLIGNTSWSAPGPIFPNTVGSPTMLFWNSQDGVIVEPSYASPALSVYWTRNGGNSWQETAVPLAYPASVFQAPTVTRGVNGQLRVTIVSNSKATMAFTSRDGGSTWTAVH